MVPNSPSQADTGVLSLMQGVVAAEGSGGNPTALGDYNAQKQATAAGIGMWSNEDPQGIPQPLQQGEIPTHFAQMAKEYGLNPTDFSIGNQNKVLYAELATDKAQGLSPAQALSKWNSGRANAYQTSPVEGSSVSATGTSNVGAYVQKGLAAAQKYAQSQGQNGQSNGQQDVVSGAGNVGLNSIPVTSLGGGQIPQGSQPSPIPITQLNLPPSATDNSASSQTISQEFNQSLPLGTKILQGQNVGAQQGQDTAMGIAKGIGSTLLSGTGATSNPVIEGMLSRVPGALQGIAKIQQGLQGSNPTQSAASGQTQTAANFLPIGGPATEIADVAREASIPEKAAQIASEKPTLGTVAKGLMSFGDDAQAAKDAQAITPLVKNGMLSVGNDAKTTAKNTATLQGEISNAADKLVDELKGGDIQQVVQPEHLTEAYQDGLKTITDEADNVEQATAKYQQYWNKFLSYLPKDREVLSSDTLQARKSFDQWLGNVNRSSIFDPTVENSKTIAARLVRQNANGITAANAPSVAVKDSLAYQSSLYNVLENVAKKGAPAIKKANELANMPGIKGLVMRHPYTVGAPLGAAGTALTGLIGGAGALEGAKALGFNPLESVQ